MHAHRFGGPHPDVGASLDRYGDMKPLMRCMHCETTFHGHFGLLRLCYAHSYQRSKDQIKAIRAVRREISEGRLPPVATQYCVDCGRFAMLYDHRNYNEPLKVEPVCGSCNQLRGPAQWTPARTGGKT